MYFICFLRGANTDTKQKSNNRPLNDWLHDHDKFRSQTFIDETMCCRCHIYDNYPVWKTVSRKSIADVVPGDEDHAGHGPQLHEHHPHGVAEGAETL